MAWPPISEWFRCLCFAHRHHWFHHRVTIAPLTSMSHLKLLKRSWVITNKVHISFIRSYTTKYKDTACLMMRMPRLPHFTTKPPCTLSIVAACHCINPYVAELTAQAKTVQRRLRLSMRWKWLNGAGLAADTFIALLQTTVASLCLCSYPAPLLFCSHTSFCNALMAVNQQNAQVGSCSLLCNERYFPPFVLPPGVFTRAKWFIVQAMQLHLLSLSIYLSLSLSLSLVSSR